MGERFLAETVYRSRGVVGDPARMAKTVALLIEAEAGSVLVSESDRELVGMILMALFENPITAELTATELAWWVEPAHRGTGIRLLKRAEAWARAQGCRKVQMVAPTPQVEELYARLGYDYLEASYQKALA
jgi:GNAT superfamily N-acetyltransferase